MMSGWSLIRIATILVYLFLFAPVAVVILLAFNANQFGAFPIEGFSMRWFEALWNNDAIVRAFKTSLILGALTSAISTTLGTLAALAMVRYDFPGKRSISTLLVAPILIPEVVLAVALLLFLQFLSMPKSFGLLLMGHVVFTLPFVVLVVQARLVSIRLSWPECCFPSPSRLMTSPAPCSGNRAVSKLSRPRFLPCCAIPSARKSMHWGQ